MQIIGLILKPVHPRAYGGYIAVMSRCCVVSVHPRVYGGYFIFVSFGACGPGSSPRIRGRQANDKWVIPAGAGESPCGTPVTSGSGVHPRSRGGKFSQADWVVGMNGSSPLTRGTRQPRHLHGDLDRGTSPRVRGIQANDKWVIPAYTGDTD